MVTKRPASDPVDRFLSLRKQMVDEQLKRRGIWDSRVLIAMEQIPRHLFVEKKGELDAYKDCPLSIPCGQTISQPFIVAKTAELLNLQGQEKVLEIGAGCGYQSAILALLSRQVVALERIETLVNLAKENLLRTGITNVDVRLSDGKEGCPSEAPFDRILVSCASERVMPAWENQLKVGGSLIVPLQSERGQRLYRYSRAETGWRVEDLFAVKYVPLI